MRRTGAVDLAVAELDRVVAARDLLPHAVLRRQVGASLVDVRDLHCLPIRSSPSSGSSSPAIIRKSVVLPAPFGPITPTIPPGGRVAQILDQQSVAVALRDAVGLDHDVSEPRAGWDVDLDAVELDVALLCEQPLVCAEAGLRLRVSGLR